MKIAKIKCLQIQIRYRCSASYTPSV